jgi:hypothetical protein
VATRFGFDFFALLLIARDVECDSWFVLSPGHRLGSIIPCWQKVAFAVDVGL